MPTNYEYVKWPVVMKIVQVVCGAPNARAGIKIPFATVGAVVAGDDA